MVASSMDKQHTRVVHRSKRIPPNWFIVTIRQWSRWSTRVTGGTLADADDPVFVFHIF